MNKFSKIFVLALGFGVLAVVLGLVTNRRVGAAGPPSGLDVHVVNNPLAVTGSIGLSGTVPVTNPGTLTPIPLVVSNTDGPGHTPVQGTFSDSTSTYTVPADKRLVIEYASGECAVSGPGTLEGAGISTKVGVLNWSFFLPFTSVSATFVTFFGPIHVYADPGTKLATTAIYTGTPSVSCSGHFAGYLTNP